MKPRNLALTAITLAFSTIAAFPTVVQGAEMYESTRAKECRLANDAYIQYGLPTVDCAAFEKTAGGVMGPVRTMDTRSKEQQTSTQCREGNDARNQWGLPTLQC